MTHGATLLLDECENTGVSEGTHKVLGGEDTLFGAEGTVIYLSWNQLR